MGGPVQRAWRGHFPPWVRNRRDETVIFHSLARGDIRHIVEVRVAQLRGMLADRQIDLVLSPVALDTLADEGYDPHFGARPLKRTIQRRIQNPLSVKLLEGAFHPGDTVEVGVADGGFTFSVRQPQAADV